MGAAGGTAPPAVVGIVRVAVAGEEPGVTEVGLNAGGPECAGRPLTLKVTAFVKPRAVGVTVIWIVAGWPALTEGGAAGPVTVYPSTVKVVLAAVVPPPGLGFVTVTLAVPAEDASLAGIAAVSCVALTKVVGSAFGVPVPTMKLITEVETKFVPFTVSVKAAPPGA